MRKYDPTITDRVMVTLDGESIPNEKYPEVYYGYDNIKRKVVQATGNRRFGAVFHYCGLPQPNSVNYDYKMISTQENPYETHNIDMDQQRIIDERWLTKICESIRWKPKKD